MTSKHAYLPARPRQIPVHEHFRLSTVQGAEDLLLGDVERAPGVAAHWSRTAMVSVTLDGELDPLMRNPLWADAYIPIHSSGTRETLQEALSVIERSCTDGILRAISGAVLRFRIVGSSAPDRRRAADALGRAFGWVQDHSSWDLSLVLTDQERRLYVGAMHWTARFAALDRLPWSTKPMVASALVHMAKISPKARVVDPCCGTATILIAAALVADCQLVGTDIDARAVACGNRNLIRHGVSASITQTNAVPISQADAAVDRVITNLPFGKLVGTHTENEVLYPLLTREIARVLAPDGRAVLLTDDKRLLLDAVTRTRGLKIVRERILRYGGVAPTAYVLVRTRTSRRR